MDARTSEQITRQLFDLFVDVDRLRITGRLIEREWTVSALAQDLGLKLPSTLSHLSRLEDAGLLNVNDEGGQRRYRFDIATLRALNQQVRDADPGEASPQFEDAGARDQKILADFFNGPLLKTIPAQRDKRLVVCAWLASQFAPDTDYPEREVNDILTRHHPDFATLRRQLVDDSFLTRDHGVYRRVMDSTGQ